MTAAYICPDSATHAASVVVIPWPLESARSIESFGTTTNATWTPLGNEDGFYDLYRWTEEAL